MLLADSRKSGATLFDLIAPIPQRLVVPAKTRRPSPSNQAAIYRDRNQDRGPSKNAIFQCNTSSFYRWFLGRKWLDDRYWPASGRISRIVRRRDGRWIEKLHFRSKLWICPRAGLQSYQATSRVRVSPRSRNFREGVGAGGRPDREGGWRGGPCAA